MKIANILIIISFLFSCASEPNNLEEVESNFDCPYKELVAIDNKEKHSSGNTVTGSISILLKSNIKKLGEGQIELNGIDTSFIERVDKIYTEKTSYSTDFFERHNSIIQILCAIEKDIRDTSTSQLEKNKLFDEKIKKRTQYFDFLLGKREVGETKTKNKESKPVKSNFEISSHDKNIRGILIPPKKFPIDSMVEFDIGGRGVSYDVNQLRNGSIGQPKIPDIPGIHVLTYDDNDTPYGSLLSFHLNDKGYLTISALFYEQEKGIVGLIRDNYFLVNSDYFSWNFDDKGLEVVDSDLNVVLLIDFEEGNKIKIRGILGVQGLVCIITDNKLQMLRSDDVNYLQEIRKAKKKLKPVFEYVKLRSFGKRKQY